MNGSLRPWRWIAIVLMMLSACGARAEDAYVIDRLLVGVHESKDMKSPIVKVLPTGTKLEVVAREGSSVQVKGPEGVTGWIDASYLMQERPARLVAEALEKENKTLQDQVENLKKRLAKQKEDKPAANEAPPAQPAQAPTNGELKRIQEENLALKQQLEQQREALKKLEQSQPSPATAAAPPASAPPGWMSAFSPTAYVIAVCALLLSAFGGGAYFTDYLQRRRHGGFRL